MSPTLSLLLATGALATGPMLALFPWRRARVHALLDGFVLVMVVGLCLVWLLPDAFESLGLWAALFALAGFVLPHLAESKLHHHQHGESSLVLGLAFLGLLVHASIDGATLALDSGATEGIPAEQGTAGLVLAVVLHRLPVSLFVWWTLRPKLGPRVATTFLASLAAATGVGYAISGAVHELAHGIAGGILHAILAGGLLHVVLDHGPHEQERRSHSSASAVGAALAVLLFAVVPKGPQPTTLTAAIQTSTDLLLESGMAIFLGFLGAGLLTMVPTRSLARLMTGRNSFTSALRGVIFGLPLPVCSCGVVPLYRGLVHKGVPAAAAMAFLVATPELGMDAIIISLPLLGLELALVRVGAAILVALAAGLVAGVLVRGPAEPDAPRGTDPSTERRSLGGALRYGFVESVDDLGPWILAGLVVAGLLEPMLTPSLAQALPALLEVPFFAALATPLYICASGATPVAAVLLSKGISAGAVVAFLISGPATNVTTFGAIRSANRLGTTIALVLTIPIASILVGWLLDSLGLGTFAADVVQRDHDPNPWHIAFAVAFALVLAASFFRQGPRGFLLQLGIGHEEHTHDHAADEDHDSHDHDSHDHGEGDSVRRWSLEPEATPPGRSS